MPSIFTKIINGEIPCHKIAESEKYLAFLDIFPLRKGHVLVVPKQETDYIFDLEDELLGEMAIFAKKVAKAIESTIPCERIGVVVLGLEVPHAHIHLIPISDIHDIDFSQAKLKLSQEELARIAENIRNNII